MMSLLILFLIKLADSTLGTMKSVFTYQGSRWLAMFAVTGSQMMYLLLITRMEEGVGAFVAVALAVMAGQVLGMNIGEKFQKEKVWKISVTMGRSKGVEVAQILRDLGIPNHTVKSFESSPTITLVAYATTKESTTEIMSYIPQGSHVEITELKKHFETGV